MGRADRVAFPSANPRLAALAARGAWPRSTPASARRRSAHRMHRLGRAVAASTSAVQDPPELTRQAAVCAASAQRLGSGCRSAPIALAPLLSP